MVFELKEVKEPAVYLQLDCDDCQIVVHNIIKAADYVKENGSLRDTYYLGMINYYEVLQFINQIEAKYRTRSTTSNLQQLDHIYTSSITLEELYKCIANLHIGVSYLGSIENFYKEFALSYPTLDVDEPELANRIWDKCYAKLPVGCRTFTTLYAVSHALNNGVQIESGKYHRLLHDKLLSYYSKDAHLEVRFNFHKDIPTIQFTKSSDTSACGSNDIIVEVDFQSEQFKALMQGMIPNRPDLLDIPETELYNIEIPIGDIMSGSEDDFVCRLYSLLGANTVTGGIEAPSWGQENTFTAERVTDSMRNFVAYQLKVTSDVDYCKGN